MNTPIEPHDHDAQCRRTADPLATGWYSLDAERCERCRKLAEALSITTPEDLTLGQQLKVTLADWREYCAHCGARLQENADGTIVHSRAGSIDCPPVPFGDVDTLLVL